MTSHSKHYSMTLSDLINGYLNEADLDEKFNSTIIEGLSLDSRNIKEHFLFLAIKGETVNGIEFITMQLSKVLLLFCGMQMQKSMRLTLIGGKPLLELMFQ